MYKYLLCTSKFKIKIKVQLPVAFLWKGETYVSGPMLALTGRGLPFQVFVLLSAFLAVIGGTAGALLGLVITLSVLLVRFSCGRSSGRGELLIEPTEFCPEN